MRFGKESITTMMLVTLLLLTSLGVVTANFQLEIIHSNDLHSRFLQTNQISGVCSSGEASKNQCYGGYARMSEAVKMVKSRNKDKKSLFLIAGDVFQGSVWYTFFKWEMAATMTNLLKPDAMSLGNHEFDDGVEGLAPFIDNASFPILATNLDTSNEKRLALPNLKNSVIFTANNGVKIAVIGYVTPETKELSLVENVNFLDEVESIKAEIAKLKTANPDLKIFIALGHSGYEREKKIAELVPEIDVIVGGHSHTFLYTGKQPDKDVSLGPYPTWVTQKTGRKVPVVQAYAYTKYLGDLSVEFNDNGEVISATGSPILLDNKIPQDQAVLKELSKWEKLMSNEQEQPVGETKTFLDGTILSCRLKECNMGNLITDAFVDYMAELHKQPNTDGGWRDLPIAVITAGVIRGSINASNKNGVVTMGELLVVLPFQNKMVPLRMQGSDILEMLEWSVDGYNPKDPKGKFLQMSGLKVVYDLKKPNKKRVVEVLVRSCADCKAPTYKPIELEGTYSVLMPVFLANGGDGYTMLKKSFVKVDIIDVADTEMLTQYFRKHSPVNPVTEGRIKFLGQEERFTSGADVILPILVLPIVFSFITIVSLVDEMEL